MKGNRIITIGRQIGSGGSEIGMEVAKRLGIQCYDRQLIEMACNYGELDQDILAEAEEKRPNPFLYSVPRQMQNDKTGRGIAINDMVFNLQSEVIRQLAEQIKKFSGLSQNPVILTSQVMRIHFYHLVEPFYPNIRVLSFNEIANNVQIQSIGNISTMKKGS